MALDRQKILNELGSVMNQLKNADCGCMEKLFGRGTDNAHVGGHGRTCFGHHPCPSEPLLPRLNLGTMNPAKLYTDTFNYLNKNLMQPTIKEVYDELKGINNMNTVMNHPSHNQANARASPAAAIKAQMLKNAQLNSQKDTSPDMAPTSMAIPTGKMMDGNMNIVSDMNSNVGMKGDAISNMANISNQNYAIKPGMNTQRDMTTVNAANPAMISRIAPVENHISAGSMPSNTVTDKKCHYASPGLGSDIMQMMCKKPDWKLHQPDTNSAPGESHLGQQPAVPHQSQHMKFNQMYPRLEGFGESRLGYDPMAIAFEMNPANTEKVAVESMAKCIHNDNHAHKSRIENLTSGQTDNTYQTTNLTPGETSMYRQYLPNQDPMVAYNQQNVKPYFGNESQSNVAEVDYNKMKRDAIYPIETSLSSPTYNALGQPVAEYQTTESGLKRTLPTPYATRHFRNDPSFYSSVKNTVSKTSLMGTPQNNMGNTNKLNHLYNQYKGSQSYTHQAVKPPVFDGSMSVGRLNTSNLMHGNASQLTPIEKFGGDTVDCSAPCFTKLEPVTLGGDVVATQKVQKYDSAPKEPHVVPRPAVSRNGLQDIVFTTYNTAPAWSFYRNSRSSPFPA